MPKQQPDLPFGRDDILIRSPRPVTPPSPPLERYARPPERQKTEEEILRDRSTEDLQARMARLSDNIAEADDELVEVKDKAQGFKNRTMITLENKIDTMSAERECIRTILATRAGVQSTTRES